MARPRIELTSHFREVAERTRREVRAVPRESAERIAAMARANAPVKTGELRDSIGVVETGEGEAEVQVGAAHGPVVELGGVFTPASPYLGPAAAVERRAFVVAAQRAVVRGARG
jgi:HK97 gp10 family phage protein